MKKQLKRAGRTLLRRVGFSLHRDPPKPRKTSIVTTAVVCGKTIKIYRGNPLKGEYSRNPTFNRSIGQVAALVAASYPDSWAIDVGANVGDTLAIIKSNASLPVICIEGDPHVYRLLQENAHQFQDVYTFNTFLSEKPGEVLVESRKSGWNTTLIDCKAGASGQKFQVDTLDRVIQGMQKEVDVKFLKVDAEGYDMRILKGAAAILDIHKPTITFELNRENIEPLGDSAGDFFDYMIELGYSNFILTDANGRLVCTLAENSRSLLEDLYNYSNAGQPIYYYDVWAFHKTEQKMFEKRLSQERTQRVNDSK